MTKYLVERYLELHFRGIYSLCDFPLKLKTFYIESFKKSLVRSLISIYPLLWYFSL